MKYTMKLTMEQVKAVHFAQGRYGWADYLSGCLDSKTGDVEMYEHEAWCWMSDVDEDDAKFPLASPEFADKLQRFYDSIV